MRFTIETRDDIMSPINGGDVTWRHVYGRISVSDSHTMMKTNPRPTRPTPEVGGSSKEGMKGTRGRWQRGIWERKNPREDKIWYEFT